MIPALLTQIGLPILIRILGGTLQDINHPTAQNAANALNSVSDALTIGTIPSDQLNQAQSHLQKMAELEASHLETAMQEINTSLRAEIASQDIYVRRMRPTFGYLMAITWAAQMLALAYVIVMKTEHAGLVLQAMGSLGAIWAVGLSVLGIYVYKRSEDKKLHDNITGDLTSRLFNISRSVGIKAGQSSVPNQNLNHQNSGNQTISSQATSYQATGNQAIQVNTSNENDFNT